jgi:allophanate hydrolase subunit 2
MNKHHELKLVDGDFNADDCLEVVSCLLRSKINFHHGRALSMHERFGIDPAHSLKRVAELKASLEQLQRIVEQARANGQRVRIDSTVHLTVTAETEVAV